MCHQWSPQPDPVAIIIFKRRLFCDSLKSGDVRTETCAKTMITTGLDCGAAEWIKSMKQSVQLNQIELAKTSTYRSSSQRGDIQKKVLLNLVANLRLNLWIFKPFSYLLAKLYTDLLLLFYTIDPQGRLTITAGSDHYFFASVVCTFSVRPSLLFKITQNKTTFKWETGGTVSLVEWIIDDTHLLFSTQF